MLSAARHRRRGGVDSPARPDRSSARARTGLVLVLAAVGVGGCAERGRETAGSDWTATAVSDRAGLVATRAQRAAHQSRLALPAPTVDPTRPNTTAEADDGTSATTRGETLLLGPAAADDVPALVRARALLDGERFEEALVVLRRARIGADVADAALPTLEGRVLLALERTKDARGAFTEALQKAGPGTPERAEALYGRSRAALAEGDLDAAEADFKALKSAALADPPGEAGAVELLGAALAQARGQGAATLEALRAAAPHDPRAAATLGAVLGRQGDHAGAVEALRVALKGLPDDANLHLQLGTALASTGALEEAEAALTRSTALEATAAQSWRNLAAVRERRGNLRGALAAWQALLRYAPEADVLGTVATRVEALRTQLQSARPTP